jgi:hypothetical protein
MVMLANHQRAHNGGYARGSVHQLERHAGSAGGNDGQ